MVPDTAKGHVDQEQTVQSLAYIRQILGELRNVARREKADMLAYLIEMAYVEAGDLQMGRNGRSDGRADRDPSSRMSV